MGRLSDVWQVERKDLSAFHRRTADLALDLQKQGWKVRHSQKNHLQFLAPDGVTTFATSNNEASYPIFLQKVESYWRAHPEHAPSTAKAKAKAPSRVQCPRPGCGKWFVDLDHLNVHINVDHEGLVRCPDCKYTHAQGRYVMLHRSQKHGYESPKKAQRKAAEARRKVKRQDHEAVEAVGIKVEHRYWQDNVVPSEPLMDTAEILANTTNREIHAALPRYDSESLGLKPVPAPEKPATTVRQISEKPWRDVPVEDILDMDVRALLYAYKAVGLQLRLQVRGNE